MTLAGVALLRRAGSSADQLRAINVPIRSAGQARLSGALVKASTNAGSPGAGGTATMW